MDWIDPQNQQITVGTINTRISNNLNGGSRIMAQSHTGTGMRSMMMRKMTVIVAV